MAGRKAPQLRKLKDNECVVVAVALKTFRKKLCRVIRCVVKVRCAI